MCVHDHRLLLDCTKTCQCRQKTVNRLPIEKLYYQYIVLIACMYSVCHQTSLVQFAKVQCDLLQLVSWYRDLCLPPGWRAGAVVVSRGVQVQQSHGGAAESTGK